MRTNESAESLRYAISHSRRGDRARYSNELRERILGYVEQRTHGKSVQEALSEIGVSGSQFYAWKKVRALPQTPPRFMPVRVAVEQPAHSALIVHGPHGVRIEGLSVVQVATLLQQLTA